MGATGSEGFEYAGEMLVGAAGSSPGLYYIGARWMDPALGRWYSLDPELGKLSMPQTMNRYVYCVNNPLRFVDPTGLKTSVPRHQESDMDLDEFMYLIGFIPVVDVVSDLYFFAKAVYYEDWETAAFYAGCAAVPFVGSSWAKLGAKTAVKNLGVKWLDDLATVGRRENNVPTVAGRNVDSYLDGKRVTLVLEQDLEGYRIFGGSTAMRGSWFALTPPGSRRIAQDLYSLPPGNTAEFCARATIPKGAAIEIGIAAPLGRWGGGGVQVFVRNSELPTFIAPWRLPG